MYQHYLVNNSESDDDLLVRDNPLQKSGKVETLRNVEDDCGSDDWSQIPGEGEETALPGKEMMLLFLH